MQSLLPPEVFLHPSTGSTGDGYRFAKELGHTITDLSPALVPFVAKEEVCKELQGTVSAQHQRTDPERKESIV